MVAIQFNKSYPYEITLTGEFSRIKKRHRTLIEDRLCHINGLVGTSFMGGADFPCAFAFDPNITTETAVKTAARAILDNIPITVSTIWRFDLVIGLPPRGAWYDVVAPRLEALGITIYNCFAYDTGPCTFPVDSRYAPSNALAAQIKSALAL